VELGRRFEPDLDWSDLEAASGNSCSTSGISLTGRSTILITLSSSLARSRSGATICAIRKARSSNIVRPPQRCNVLTARTLHGRRRKFAFDVTLFEFCDQLEAEVSATVETGVETSSPYPQRFSRRGASPNAERAGDHRRCRVRARFSSSPRSLNNRCHLKPKNQPVNSCPAAPRP